jgi:AcrR family transcriptional regulator
MPPHLAFHEILGVLTGSVVDKNERRQQILQNARDVFAKHGYHAAKIDDIVAAAGIARGTFYSYFEDKRAIFDEIIDQTFARIGASIIRVDTDDPGRSVGEQVRQNIRAIVHALLEDRATTKILLSDAVGLDPELDKKLMSFYEAIGQMLESSLTDGQERGIVAPGDVRMFSIMSLGAMKEIMYQVTMRDLGYPEDRIVGEVYNFLCQGYLRSAR